MPMSPIYSEALEAQSVFLHGDPENLPEDVDPLILHVCERINGSGWVWTTESCQGHPDSDDNWLAPWQDNMGPYLRLLVRREDRGQMMQCVLDALEHGWTPAAGFRVYVENHFVPEGEERPTSRPDHELCVVLLYSTAKTVGQRDHALLVLARFADSLHEQDRGQ